MNRRLRILPLLAASLLLTGCGLGYYWQAATGQLQIWRLQRPIEAVLADPATPPALADRLRYALAAREFAVRALNLEDNASYTRYVALDREGVVWNVVAVPEFSLQAHRWCVPVAGCVTYRGYFARRDAEDLAAQFAARGFDTRVYPVSAYSTLGWFADPLLSTMLAGGDASLAATLFHELAHQRFYLQDDTAFNEAMATAVEQHLMRRWLMGRNEVAALADYELRLVRRAQFDALLDRHRARLIPLYAREDLEPAAMRQAKAQAFVLLGEEYANLRASWPTGPHFDGWFARELNNADVLAQAAYRQWLPGFERMLAQTESLSAFFAAVERLAALPAAERAARLVVSSTDATEG